MTNVGLFLQLETDENWLATIVLAPLYIQKKTRIGDFLTNVMKPPSFWLVQFNTPI
jgi:hypothetical protein